MIGSEPEQRRERNAEVEGIALIEAERTRRISKDILEKEKAANSQRADNGDCGRCSERRVAADQSNIVIHSAY